MLKNLKQYIKDVINTLKVTAKKELIKLLISIY